MLTSSLDLLFEPIDWVEIIARCYRLLCHPDTILVNMSAKCARRWCHEPRRIASSPVIRSYWLVGTRIVNHDATTIH